MNLTRVSLNTINATGRNSERDWRTDEARVLFTLPSYPEFKFVI